MRGNLLDMKKLDQSVVDLILRLRRENKTRSEIVELTGFPMGRVKKVLGNARLVLPMEVRQSNAYRAKLAKNPDAMRKMRETLTPQVVERRSASIRLAYQDECLRKLKGDQSKKRWASLSKTEIASLAQAKTGEDSIRVRTLLKEEGFPDMRTRYAHLVKDKGELLGEYKGGHVKTSWRCLKGHVFEMMPYVVTNGHWCPSCSHVGPSVAQLEIYEYVLALMPDHEVLLGDRKSIAPMELDVYIPSKKLGIEYNGLLHHSDYFGEKSGRHFKKFQACSSADVDLLAIFEDEWRDKKELVKSMIAWRLGRFAGKSYRASKLSLGPVPAKQQKAFFDRNHLDGYAIAKSAIGLFDGSRLVQCVSLRRNFSSEYEICRLATDFDCHVQGGASRLIAALKRSLGTDAALVTYSNNRLSRGNVYRETGFKLLQENKPSYWYTDGKVRVWRWKCRRINDPDVLASFPTEKDQARAGVFSEKLFSDRRPLYRVEDYGHRKWVL